MKPDIFASNTTETNPFPYTDNQIFLDVNPSSMEEEEYLHFPDPFLDDDDLFLSHFLSQQQHLFAGDGWEDHQTNNNPNKHNSDKPTAEGKKKCSRKIATNRTGKKDRHSKICTAQGPRDRRMRLSLQIARKFFDLQDMLGFDKASKTIDWLLSNSKSAIKELKDNLNPSYSYGSVSSGSSEVLSEVMDNNVGQQGQKRFSAPKEATFMGILKDKKSRPLRTVARESRDRARARARERTQGKLILKGLENSKPTSHSHSVLQTEENSRFNFQGVNLELQEDPQFEEHPADSVSRIEEHKIFSISDLPDFPWDGKCPPLTHSFCSGNRQLQCPDPTLSCPYSIFMATPTLPHPKPYNFSDTTLLKLP